MRFEIFALPILAALVDAAAISSSSCTTCPVTIKDTSSAISSVYSQMSAQSPKQTHAAATTTTVIGSPIASSGVAKMTTASSVAKTTSTVKTSSSAKSASSAKTTSSIKTTSSAKTTAKTTSKASTSSKKLQRRATSTSSTSTTNVNSACATQPNYGYTYVPSNGDATKFLKDTTLRTAAMTQNSPVGYTWKFAAYYGSQYQSGYMYETELSSYNVTQCAAICTGDSGCKGFNIYFERDPTLMPGNGCSDPAPQTNVRCAFYNAALSEVNAVNIGSWRDAFAVLITGANGYNKL